MFDDLSNNEKMKYLLINFFDSDRKKLAKATHKSLETVNYWFRAKSKTVGSDTVELLLYKLNKSNCKLKLN